MRGSSHLAIGILTGLGTPLLFPTVHLSATGVCLAAFSALVADIDEQHSILSKTLTPPFEKFMPPPPMIRKILLIIGGFLLAYGGLSLDQLHTSILVLLFTMGIGYGLLAVFDSDKKLPSHSIMAGGATLFLGGYLYSYGEVMMTGLVLLVVGTIFQTEKMRAIFLSVLGGGIAFLGFAVSMWWLLVLGLFFAFAPWLPHRGLTHTVWAVGIWGYICFGMEAFFQTPGLMWMGVAGYLSHLTADSLTKERVKWLAPIPIVGIPIGIPLIRVGSERGDHLEKITILILGGLVFLEYALQADSILR